MNASTSTKKRQLKKRQPKKRLSKNRQEKKNQRSQQKLEAKLEAKRQIQERLEKIFFPFEIICLIINFIDDNKTFFSMAFTCSDCYQYCMQLYKKTELKYRDEIFSKVSLYPQRLIGSSIYHILLSELPHEYHIDFNKKIYCDNAIKTLQNLFRVYKKLGTENKYKLTRGFVNIYCILTDINKRLVPLDQMLTDISSLSISAEYMTSMLMNPESLSSNLLFRIDGSLADMNLTIKDITKNIFAKKFSICQGEINFLCLNSELRIIYYREDSVHPSLWKSEVDFTCKFFRDHLPKLIEKLRHIEKLVKNGWQCTSTEIIKFPPYNLGTSTPCQCCSIPQEQSIHFRFVKCDCIETIFCLECFIKFLHFDQGVDDIFCSKCKKSRAYTVKWTTESECEYEY